MKTIINQLVKSLDLKVSTLRDDIDLAYFEDKDDFFILMYSTFSELTQLTDSNLTNIQFALNSLVVDLKTFDILRALQHRSINQNLSLLLFIEYENSISHSFKELNKAEENYINAKKYILPYRVADLEALMSKINTSDDIIKVLNDLAVDNSPLLEQNEESWYDLLLNLFIKIPFLNYRPQDGQQSIGNLSSMITESLNPRQNNLLSIIDGNNIASITDIETFAATNNMLR